MGASSQFGIALGGQTRALTMVEKANNLDIEDYLVSQNGTTDIALIKKVIPAYKVSNGVAGSV